MHRLFSNMKPSPPAQMQVTRVLIGGPAFNSEQIEEGDLIVAIDGEVLEGHEKDAAGLLRGNDSVG